MSYTAWDIRHFTTNHTSLNTPSDSIEDVLVQVAEDERKKIINAFFTPLGYSLGEISSELYSVNCLPQHSQLCQKERSDWDVEVKVDGYHLQLWNSGDFPDFERALRAFFKVEPAFSVFFVRIVKCHDPENENRAFSQPPLSAFMHHGEQYLFNHRKKNIYITGVLQESSMSFNNLEGICRKTGFLAFSKT